MQPDSARAYQALAEIYARAQQTDQAILNYRKALELEPRNVAVRLTLGELLFRARRLPGGARGGGRHPRRRSAEPLRPRPAGARLPRDLRQFDRASRGRRPPAEGRSHRPQGLVPEVTSPRPGATSRPRSPLLEKILARDRTGEADGAGQRPRLPRPPRLRLPAARPPPRGRGRLRARGGHRRAPTPRCSGSTSRRCSWPRTTTPRWPTVRAARARHPAGPRPARARGQRPARAGRHRRRPRPSSRRCASRRRATPPCWPRSPTSTSRPSAIPAAEATLREARELDPRNLRVLFQLGAVLERQKRHDDAEAAFREALAVEPDSAPVLNYLGYMNADRGVRVDGGGAAHREGARPRSRERRLPRQPGLGAVPPRPRRPRPRSTCAAPSTKRAPTRSCSTTWATCCAAAARCAEAVEYWRRALEAEDEDEELDRARVERKIREAQAQPDRRGQGNDPNP